MDYKEFRIFRKRVKDKWLKYASDLWWGDRLDSRFIALWYLKTIKNKKILDLGCSVGIVLSELDESNQIYGIDKSRDKVLIAKNLLGDKADIREADMFCTPFDKHYFDLLIFFGMFTEVANNKERARSLKEITRVLKDGGELIITVANSDYPWSGDKGNRIDYHSLKNLLKEDFDSTIYGFNPFPGFPLFLPNRVMENIPWIWNILIYMMRKEIMLRHCRSFLALARKKYV